MFFLLSGRHRMHKSVRHFHEDVGQLGKRSSLYRLPSFRKDFSDWVTDTAHLDPVRSERALDRVYCWEERVGLRLPGIFTMLKREWC